MLLGRPGDVPPSTGRHGGLPYERVAVPKPVGISRFVGTATAPSGNIEGRGPW